jgi:UDP-2,3-diacylglucosamine hydrolase
VQTTGARGIRRHFPLFTPASNGFDDADLVSAASKFLPSGFSPEKPFAILAGKGIYPRLIAHRARKAGVRVKLLALEDETDPDFFTEFAPEDRRMVNIGQLGKALDALESFAAPHAVMAGQITPKKLFGGLKFDLKAMLILARLKHRNAETIYGALADELAKRGITLCDARAFMDEDLASEGVMTGGSFKADADALAHGIHIAREMARLDVGQGVVVSRGTVVAVEAFEGTNEMLRRAGTFGAKELIFIKTVKPGQDWRIDVPVFGLRTVEVMREAGITHAALQAECTLMLEKPKVVAAAREAGIRLLGYA